MFVFPFPLEIMGSNI